MYRSIECLDIRTQDINKLKAKDIFTVGDLATYKPRKYLDYRKIVNVRDIKDKEDCIMYLKVFSVGMGKKNTIQITCKDRFGDKIYLTIFNGHKGVFHSLKEGECYYFIGRTTINPPFKNMIVSMFSQDKEKMKRIMPVYSKIQNMSDETLKKHINTAVELVPGEDFLDRDIITKYNLIDNKLALRIIHNPENMEDLEKAKKRLLFNELFIANLKIQKSNNKEKHDLKIESFNLSRQIMDSLPFELTEGQRSGLRSMSQTLRNGNVLRALVQGDVGCGKTIFSLLITSVILEAGAQGALMAPTTVLAKQHYKDAVELFEPLGIKVGLLTGEMTSKQKKAILKELEEGEIRLIIGTHSLISDSVKFQNLAIAIIDEEHRFGVEQREALKEKGKNVSLVSVSATPIPRSLAFTLYGDSVDVYAIKGLPKGRQPITTTLVQDVELGYAKLIEEVRKGRQGYVVCPLIAESDAETLKDVVSVEETKDILVAYFKKNNAEDIKIGVINGAMSQEEIVAEIGKFANKEYDVIISTTIIEVGVNVPNSTMILIQNAERFGLAQLHQLRGRVGRGSHKSYCMLQTNMKKEETLKKLNVIVNSQDGFVIAEEDMLLRGTGNLAGLEQSGSSKMFEYMIRNKELNEKIIQDARRILSEPALRFKYKKIIDNQIKLDPTEDDYLKKKSTKKKSTSKK